MDIRRMAVVAMDETDSLIYIFHWRFMCALTDLYVSSEMQVKRQQSLGSMISEPLPTVIHIMHITV